eukprot:TRINITY_DN3488_c0_g1_i1.p1 TRINITY_DN3488_c0_g1~~TRINITY_DN3488_c0_g1_i1.p1  ORF type:complete len:698 (+),score=128.31 TRINITY_DN3488_c0_g1_i1:1408-3501(+)
MGFKEIAADFRAAKPKFLKGYFFTKLDRDDLTIDLTFSHPESGIEEDCTIAMSEEYPAGEYMLLGSHGHVQLRGNFDSILSRACFELCKFHKVTPPEILAALAAGPAEDEVPATRQKSGDVEEWGGPRTDRAAQKYLQEELDYVRAKFGADAAGFYTLPTGDVIVRAAMPVKGVDKVLAEVYGLNLYKRLVVEYELPGPHLFASSKPPTYRLIQSSSTDLNTRKLDDESSFGLTWQCEKRMERWLKSPETWPNRIRHGDVPLPMAGAAEPVKKETPKPRGIPPGVKSLALQQCIEMGFDELPSMCCLKHTNNDVIAAVQIMTSDELPHIIEALQAHLYDDYQESDLVMTKPIDFKGHTDSFLMTSLHILDWFIGTCNLHCIICDNLLKYGGLKPSICERALCNFSYEQYGLGSDLAAEVRYAPELIDMLISFACASTKGRTPEVNFDPYPLGVRVDLKAFGKSGELSFGESKSTKDFAMISKVLDAMPSLDEMRKHAISPESLKAYLDGIHPLCYPLLRWLISSNRAHMQLLPPGKQIKGMGTKWQFLMLTAPAEKEAKFRAAKEQYGSHYAFHGSSIWNWHSILRIGLKNFSNTSRMTAGAAYGPGIYLAGNSSISAGYMGAGVGWSKSVFGHQNLSCIAIAEVIKQKSYDKGGGIFVVPNEDHVVTRYFHVFSGGYSGGFDALSLKPPKNDYYTS